MSGKAIFVFDHGTTSIRACVMNEQGDIFARNQKSFEQFYPQPGWVEHDANELWAVSKIVAEEALKEAKLNWQDIAAIGMTNQRETVILWDKETGKPVHHAIVWQCRRTTEFCDGLKQKNLGKTITEKTGLVIDPYFSASKLRWLLDNVPEAQDLLKKNRLLFGTVDTWILWNLSGGKLHVTDYTNASRTMLYNIHKKCWDDELLEIFGVPREILPSVQASNVVYGESDAKTTGGVAVKLAGNAGDQQAALHGQKCWQPGLAKSTYGTGAFLVMNTGNTPVTSQRGLLTTLATEARGDCAYAMEGAIFIAGATIEWLQKKLGVLDSAKEVDALAQSLSSNEGVYLVPGFAGLGAPYWDADARAAIVGLTQDSGKAHLVRAAVEAMAYQTREVLGLMQEEAGLKLEALRVDGGVTRSQFLCQFLADVLQTPVLRSDDPELTAKGAGYLAGLAVGFWKSPDEIVKLPEQLERFEPTMPKAEADKLFLGWLGAVNRTLSEQKTPVSV